MDRKKIIFNDNEQIRSISVFLNFSFKLVTDNENIGDLLNNHWVNFSCQSCYEPICIDA